jgi:DNA-directed RNA polymerase specialized sigma24 family protein
VKREAEEDWGDDPEVALQEKNRDELLRRAVTRLSPEHRQIIDLVYYHEKSVDEAAQILDVPPATVKTITLSLGFALGSEYASGPSANLTARDKGDPALLKNAPAFS